MKTQERINVLKKEIKKKRKEIDDYFEKTREKIEDHDWAYDEHYQGLLVEAHVLEEGLKKYRLALRDVKGDK